MRGCSRRLRKRFEKAELTPAPEYLDKHLVFFHEDQLYPMGYNSDSLYQLQNTDFFNAWLKQLDQPIRLQLLSRLDRVQFGNFGDHKALGSGLFELRCFFGGGLRVYFTVRHARVVLLIGGGNQSSQQHDIKAALALLAQMEI